MLSHTYPVVAWERNHFIPLWAGVWLMSSSAWLEQLPDQLASGCPDVRSKMWPLNWCPWVKRESKLMWRRFHRSHSSGWWLVAFDRFISLASRGDERETGHSSTGLAVTRASTRTKYKCNFGRLIYAQLFNGLYYQNNRKLLAWCMQDADVFPFVS